GYFVPDLLLISRYAHSHFHGFARQGLRRAVEVADGFLATPAPASMLDAKGRYGNFARFGRQNQIVLQSAVLLAALDDLARLDIYILSARNILNRQLIDAAGLIHDHFVLLKRFLQAQEFLAGLICAVDEKNRKIVVSVRTRNPIFRSLG